jgi:hypothetical protein
VQFSILQEYIAAMLGVGMGPYTQVSDSFHIYTNVPKFEYYQTMLYSFERPPDPYVTEEVKPGYLVDNCETFDNELFCFMNNVHLDVWRNSFFPDTAIQMRKAWKAHKIRNEGAAIARTIGATDWRLACLQWLARRGDV